jgi:hypothetical protein
MLIHSCCNYHEFVRGNGRRDGGVASGSADIGVFAVARFGVPHYTYGGFASEAENRHDSFPPSTR